MEQLTDNKGHGLIFILLAPNLLSNYLYQAKQVYMVIYYLHVLKQIISLLKFKEIRDITS